MTCPRPGDDACTDHTPCRTCPTDGQGWPVRTFHGRSEGLNPVPRHPWTPHPQTGAHGTDERRDLYGWEWPTTERAALRERLLAQGFPSDYADIMCTETDRWLTDHNIDLTVNDIDET